MGYFSTHNHTHYSNIRLIDSINKPTVLIDKAIELGLTGIIITDHEALCAHMEVNDYAETLRKTHPDFTIGLGNEIYLTNDRSLGQKYYHFILIAKNAHGYRLLKELSSIAWQHSYMDKGLERVPLLKSELKDLIKEYKGDIIGTTACIGSEIGQCILGMEQARKIKNTTQATQYYNQIKEYISFCIDVFGKDDFYIECAPANNEDQILVNKKLQQIAKVYDLKMIFATDSHYLSKDQRVIHKAYLNSKEGDREVDSFYEFSYLMGEEEARELLLYSFDNNFIDKMIKNTLEIQSKITWYSLKHHPQITEVEVKDYPKQDKHKEYPTLHSLYQSDNKQERYWINQCEEGLIAKGLQDNKVYWDRLEEEADIKRTIGEKLQTNMFSYPITLQHYINLFWDCGSTVGVGRGCFVPTTLITMKDGSTKKISDVKIGDYVLSAKGNIKKVIDVLTYDCKEELYQITPSTDISKTITCTNNHEFWVMSSVPCLKDRHVCSKNCSREDCKKKELLKRGWKKAEDLTEYDYIFYPRPKLEPQKIYKIDLVDYISDLTYYNITDTGFKRINGQGNWCKRYINIDNNFMYTLGVIIGDGWTCLTKDKSCLGIAFNSSTDKDKNSMIKISNYFKELGFNSSIRKHKDKSLNQLYVYSKPLTEMFRCMVGNKAKNKKIPSELMFDNKELMLSLLEGLLASDGSYEKDHLRFSYDSINYSLISQVKELCAYLGIYASITTRPAHGKNQESYKLRASGPQLSPFIERLPLLYNKPSKNKTQTGFIVEEDGFYFRIKNISTVSYSGKVYDLTVEDDHCYLANNVGVHNSACSGLNHYLLGVTQLDPIKNNFPFWRYLNKERLELGDVDLDLCPSYLPKIFKAIRKERGELGLVQVATFGTETTKSSLIVACKGYRSEEYPNGIDVDEAQYLSSFVPIERGFPWPLEDMINGNAAKGRKPLTNFIKEMNRFPGLLDIALGISGLVSRRGSHASGVIFFDSDKIYDTCPIMKTPSGAIITQWDLHNVEKAGAVKYDFLLTSVQDIIVQTIKLLQKDNIIDPNLTIRQVYNEYLTPDKLPLSDKKIWEALKDGSVIDCFQFDSAVGHLAAKKIQPKTIDEMTDCNGLMRLMPEGEEMESPLDKYVRFKNNIKLWYKEMSDAGLTREEQQTLEPYFLKSYGVPPSQEQLMEMLMDKNICNFSLKDANTARKIVGKFLADNKLDKIEKA